MWIRRLTSLDASLLEALLLSLPPEQRRLRFCHSISTEGVRRYVAGLDWKGGDVFGAFEGLHLVGAIELMPAGPQALEGALEVHPRYQRRGIARQLVERGILHAKVLGKTELQLNCLSENGAMKQIARNHGMKLASSHGEVESKLPLAPAAPADFVAAGWQALQNMTESSRAASEWFLRAGLVRAPAGLTVPPVEPEPQSAGSGTP